MTPDLNWRGKEFRHCKTQHLKQLMRQADKWREYALANNIYYRIANPRTRRYTIQEVCVAVFTQCKFELDRRSNGKA